MRGGRGPGCAGGRCARIARRRASHLLRRGPPVSLRGNGGRLCDTGRHARAEAARRRLRGRPRLPLRLHAGLVAAVEGALRGRRRSRRRAVPRAAGRVAVVADGGRTRPTSRASRSPACATPSRALKGDRYLRRAEESPEDALGDRLTREAIWRWVTPRWQRHLERLVERERPDAVVVFTVPMAHFRGIPTALRERFGIPVVFYDGDVPMSLPEFGGMDTGFNYYHGADPGEYDLAALELGGRARAAARARRAARGGRLLGGRPGVLRAAAGREGDGRLLLRLRRQVPARVDAGDRRRAVAAPAGGRLRARRARLPRRHGPRAAGRRRAVQRLRARDLGGARQPLHHAPLARHRLRVVVVPSVRARLGRRRHRVEPLRGHRAVVRARRGAARRARRGRGDGRDPRPRRRSGAGRGARAAARASACSTSTPTATAHGRCSTSCGVGVAGVERRSRSCPRSTRSAASGA